jgi:hypothetical protein
MSIDTENEVRVFGNLDLKPRICEFTLLIRFWKPYTETDYTILIHGLTHILYYIRIIIKLFT